ncbi:ParB family chromosome partitioning protein [Salinibacterium sp. CAN_S4]|uniref:ParB/RepB/Spo0J family partition protein n=1 Tax=Salinibacterium sp. CAN_S4 TaxID=2787727 RepID=UPI0018F00221
MSDTATLGTIEHIDPSQIEVETNIRTTVKLDSVFLASIREYGVLTPVGCHRNEDGTVALRIGQRRVLAAREVGLDSIPAYIVEGDESSVTRLLEQFAENEHRASLTEPERAAVFQQLAFEGLTVLQIAKRTGVKMTVVEAGITVADSEFAGNIATKHEVTLDQAAAILEFEEDPKAVKSLVQCAEDAPDQFRHEVQRQREDRARRQRVEAEQEALREQGFIIIDRAPYYGEKAYTSIADLVTRDGKPVTIDDLGGITDKYATVRSGWDEVTSDVYLREVKAYGFKKKPATGSASGPMTDEQKAERKELIANNKAWASAEVVRREWLAGFLGRKTLPKDAAHFVATALTAHRTTIASALSGGNRLAATLLGLDAQDSEWGQSPIDPVAEAQPGRAGHVALAVVLGAIETSTGKHTWRQPACTARAYFAQIAGWGYPLSDVEQIVLGTDEPDEPSEPDEDDVRDDEPAHDGDTAA